MFMKTIKLLLTTIALLLCSVMANAYDFEVDGIFYNILSSTDLTVKVTYKGQYWDSYKEYSGVVIIPSSVTYNSRTYSVTSIGGSAFRDCSSLTSVTIPNSVTSIGEYAFYDCSSLTSVTLKSNSIVGNTYTHDSNIGDIFGSQVTEYIIGESVTSIGGYAFYNCSSLISITIPNSVTSIGSSVFSGCSSLTSITIPNSVTSIGSSVFSGCSSMTSITIPNSVTSIGERAFSYCSSLTSVTIGNSVTSIGNHAFYECSSLTSVTIPNSVTSIGGYAFYNCSSLLSITIPNSVTSIGNHAFYECSNLQSLTIGTGVLSIGSYQSHPAKVIWLPNTPPDGYENLDGNINYVPNNQYSLPNAYIYPFLSSMFETDGVKYIPISPSDRTCDVIDCIYDSTNLQIAIDSTVIFQGVEMKTKNIMPYAFYKNDFIREVSLGNSGNIESFAFENCSNLQTAMISNSGDIGTSAFENCSNLQTATISNSGDIGTSAFENCSNLQTATISNSGDIGTSAFENCSNLQTTTIFNKGDIGISAFENCSNLRIATISNIGTIGSDAFKGCSSLTTAGLGDSIKALGDNAFYQCSSLQAITIPNSVESVGKYCFSGCSNMITAVIGDGLTTIKDYTFQHCSALESLIIGNHVTTIEARAFENGSSLQNIIIPQSVRSIDNYAFNGCASLADVIIEDRSTKLELGSNGSSPLFADCPLDSVYIGGKITYNTSKNSGYSPFYRNTSLRTITITDQEEQIYENEFYGCTNLKKVIVGHGIKNIGDRAFSGCSSLDKFSFGSNVESIGAEAFSDCVNMTQIISSASIPPVCGTQALDDINKWSCVLKVPQNYKAAYQTAEQWKEFFFIEDVVEVKKFAVIYMVDNEIFAIDSLSVGEVIITIKEPTKEGYTFSGWSEVPEIMPAEDIIVTGTFTVNTYTITYIVDKEFFATDNITYGDTITPIEEPTKEGYTFSGWSEVPETMPAEDIVIDGYFSVNYYALKYTVDDEPYAVDSVAYGAVIELREKPKRDDYEFIGWSEAPETMPAHDIEVYGNFIFTSVTDVQVDPEQSQKVTEDNQLFIILPNGKKYNAMGQEM